MVQPTYQKRKGIIILYELPTRKHEVTNRKYQNRKITSSKFLEVQHRLNVLVTIP